MAENLTFNLDVNNSQAVASINTFFDAFDKGAQQAKAKLNTAFNQTIQTDIKVEFKNGQLVAKEVQSLKQESNRLAEAYKAVNGELGKTPNQLKNQKTILKTLLGDTQKFKEGTRQVSSEWKALTTRIKKVDNELKKIGEGGGGGLAALSSRFIGIQTAANLATAAIMQVARAVVDLVQTAFRMETLSLQMEAFVGSASGAEAAFDKFINIAANSPLNLEQVAGAGKIMMAFGMETGAAIQATEQLALVSAATGGDINLLARNMGQIVAQGRAYTRDLTQFAIQGIPIWEQLSVATGRNVTELKDMAKNGQITGVEVSEALRLMTREGTAFFEIGERMKETFAGRFAAIEAATQDLAKEFIEAFNAVDKAMGSIVSGSMKAMANGLKAISGSIQVIGVTAAAAAVGLGVFMALLAVAKIQAIIGALGGVGVAFALIKGQILVTLAAQLALMGAMGPAAWASAATGIAAAGAAFIAIKGKINEAEAETVRLEGGISAVGASTGELSAAQEKYARSLGSGEAVDAYKKQQEAVEGINQKMQIAVEILKKQQEVRNTMYDNDQDKLRDLIDLENEKIDIAKQGMEEAKNGIDERYDKEKTRLDEILDKVREKYDLEIGQLRAKTPAEQALYDLEKRKLQEKIRGGGLDKEELLRLQARLQRLNANEQIQALMNKKKKEESVLSERQATLDKNRKTDLAAVKTEYGSVIDASKKQVSVLEKGLKKSEIAQRDFNKEIEASIDSVDDLNSSVDSGTSSVRQQRVAVQNLAQDYAAAAAQAANMAEQIRAANAAAANSNSGGGGSLDTKASGGPVSGGTSYTVNELGKEAFLSASGALSMINAPSYGTWKAPSSGTVIPAHLTKQLDVPSGGVNISKASGASAAGGQGMNMGKMMSAIAGALGGDTVTNNVTIQSANTTQAASDVMVQLAKLKRLRYN